ncbi:hypothetical protein OZY43_05875 [Lactobacillus sp. ESL0785]|uniref:hypothetical protein n=1 Tax=Lactobacillus sp. ESL0785 TaxID=2983232 RepID=UPI0023F9E04B|nr:hypothetical protein [Lactobacillus sp. ESL0785]WEV70470.1 hypothetical protein OZY43_05875 [Lactobacillus sp. ESL0785]
MTLKRTKKYIILIIALFFLLITWHVFSAIKDNQGILIKGNISVHLFFTMQSGGGNDGIMVDLIMMLVFSIIGSGIFVYLKNSNIFSGVQQRVGYRQFLKKGIINTFLSGMGLSLITNLYEMLLINWFYFPFVYNFHDTNLSEGMRPGYFTTNDLTEILLFIILAAIGWGIFSVLVFSVGLFVQKNALYISIGPILGLILILLPILGNMNNLVWRTFSFSWFLYTLVAPGQYTFMSQRPPINSLVAFILAGVIYLVVALLIINLWYRRKLREG